MSTASYPFAIKKTYSFSLYPAILMGTNYTRAMVLSIMDYEMAKQMSDIVSKHINVFPYLPSGTPNDPSQYDYLAVRMGAGEVQVIGIPWIKLDTVELVESRTCIVTIDDVSGADLERIRAALATNGYDKLSVKLM